MPQKILLHKLPGAGHLKIKSDVGQYQSVKRAFEIISQEYGRIDVLVNSAGIAIPNTIEMNEEDFLKSWNDTIGTNLSGIANCCYSAFQIMKDQNSGFIINVSSRGAFRGEPDMLAYGASKGGVNSLTQSMARSMGKYGISVTAVAPGFVETRMARPILHGEKGEMLKNESPFKRIAKPEEVADTIFFLAQPSSLFLGGYNCRCKRSIIFQDVIR